MEDEYMHAFHACIEDTAALDAKPRKVGAGEYK